MIEVIHNPKGFESSYIEYLNQCFGDWGNIDVYNWYFNRQVGNLKADIMILKKDGEIIAGSGVSYRKVLLANNSRITVGIMTGSWTLPSARGQGCFTKIIEESVAVASDKGATFLLAFVTENNVSFRRLLNAGASLFKTYYLFSNDNTPLPKSDCTIYSPPYGGEEVKRIFGRLMKKQSGFTHFTYNFKEWKLQFLDRPTKTELLCINDTCFAIIEKKGIFDRVLILSFDKEITFGDSIKALLKRSINNERKLFLFTTSKSWKDECVNLKFGYIPGHLTTLIANENEFVKVYPSTLGVTKNNVDKLYDPHSRWYIGAWDIQSGDRV